MSPVVYLGENGPCKSRVSNDRWQLTLCRMKVASFSLDCVCGREDCQICHGGASTLTKTHKTTLCQNNQLFASWHFSMIWTCDLGSAYGAIYSAARLFFSVRPVQKFSGYIRCSQNSQKILRIFHVTTLLTTDQDFVSGAFPFSRLQSENCTCIFIYVSVHKL